MMLNARVGMIFYRLFFYVRSGGKMKTTRADEQ